MSEAAQGSPLRRPQGRLSITFKSITAPKTRSIMLLEVHATVLTEHGNTFVVEVPEGTYRWALEFLRSAQAVESVTEQQED